MDFTENAIDSSPDAGHSIILSIYAKQDEFHRFSFERH